MANVLLAQLCYIENADHSAAYQYAQAARQSNPYSCLARHQVGTLPWHIANDKDEGAQLDHLDRMIKDVTDALKIATDNLDFHVEVLARNSLAYFYSEKYQKTNAKADLTTAEEHCRALHEYYKKVHTHHYAAFLDTFAYVLSQTDDLAKLEEALTHVAKAQELVPDLPFPSDTRARILRKRRRLQGQMGY